MVSFNHNFIFKLCRLLTVVGVLCAFSAPAGVGFAAAKNVGQASVKKAHKAKGWAPHKVSKNAKHSKRRQKQAKLVKGHQSPKRVTSMPLGHSKPPRPKAKVKPSTEAQNPTDIQPAEPAKVKRGIRGKRSLKPPSTKRGKFAAKAQVTELPIEDAETDESSSDMADFDSPSSGPWLAAFVAFVIGCLGALHIMRRRQKRKGALAAEAAATAAPFNSSQDAAFSSRLNTPSADARAAPASDVPKRSWLSGGFMSRFLRKDPAASAPEPAAPEPSQLKPEPTVANAPMPSPEPAKTALKAPPPARTGPLVGVEPCSFERYVEIKIAQNCWQEQQLALEPNLRSHFEISLAEWTKIETYWSQAYLARPQLKKDHDRFEAKYKAMYGAAA